MKRLVIKTLRKLSPEKQPRSRMAHATQVSGSSACPVPGKERECRFGLMVACTKVTGSTIKPQAKVALFTQTAMFIKANGSTIKLMAKEPTRTRTALSMKETGLKISSTDGASRLGQTKPATKANMSKAKNTVKVTSSGLTKANFKVNLSRTIFRVQVLISGVMVALSLVCGKITRWMGMELSSGRMVANMKENTKTIKSQAKASFIGLMEGCTTVIGTTENSMVKEHMLSLTENLNVVAGPKVRGYRGLVLSLESK